MNNSSCSSSKSFSRAGFTSFGILQTGLFTFFGTSGFPSIISMPAWSPLTTKQMSQEPQLSGRLFVASNGSMRAFRRHVVVLMKAYVSGTMCFLFSASVAPLEVIFVELESLAVGTCLSSSDPVSEPELPLDNAAFSQILVIFLDSFPALTCMPGAVLAISPKHQDS